MQNDRPFLATLVCMQINPFATKRSRLFLRSGNRKSRRSYREVEYKQNLRQGAYRSAFSCKPNLSLSPSKEDGTGMRI